MRHCSCEMPTTSQVESGGASRAWTARFSAVARIPPRTPMMKLNCSGRFRRPWSMSGQMLLVCPTSKHSSSGFTSASFITVRRYAMSLKVFSKTKSKTNSFRRAEYLA